MPDKTYQPSPLAPIKRVQTEGGWALVFTRDLRHPVAKVWAALTVRGQLREWAPYTPDRDLTSEGAATLGMLDAEGAERPMPGTVLRVDPPRLLEHAFGEDVLRWELQPTAQGTRLVLRHSFHRRRLGLSAGRWLAHLAWMWPTRCWPAPRSARSWVPRRASTAGTSSTEQYAKVLGVPPAKPW